LKKVKENNDIRDCGLIGDEIVFYQTVFVISHYDVCVCNFYYGVFMIPSDEKQHTKSDRQQKRQVWSRR